MAEPKRNDPAPLSPPPAAGGIAARGVVKRSGNTYTATVSDGALQDWTLQVGDQRSPTQTQGAHLEWRAA